MAQHLMKASYQWATRPADERYADLASLHAATLAQRERSLKTTVALADVAVSTTQEGELLLLGNTGSKAKFSHWSFGQLASRLEAPAHYLRTLPPKTVQDLLNYGIGKLAKDDKLAQLLLWKTGTENEYDLRAITTEKYTRIWNHQIVERVMNLPGGWKVPPAYGENPSGLYAGDHDMFMFLVNEENRIQDGTDEGLARGFFVWNTECGGVAYGMDSFLYRFVCGNHIVWYAQDVTRVRVRHIGDADDRAWAALEGKMQEYLNASPREDEARIKQAKTFSLGATREDVVDTVFRSKGIAKKNVTAAYLLAEENEKLDGSPRTAWGLSQGITRLSQEQQFADARVALDRAAGRVLEMAFRK
jgi:hypothetical protein